MRGDRGGAGGAQGGAGQGSEHPKALPGAQAQPTPLSSLLSPPLLTTQLSLCLQILQGPRGASVPLFKEKKNLNRPEVLSGPTHSTVPIRVPGSSGASWLVSAAASRAHLGLESPAIRALSEPSQGTLQGK